jgi:hypothetical protein
MAAAEQSVSVLSTNKIVVVSFCAAAMCDVCRLLVAIIWDMEGVLRALVED